MRSVLTEIHALVNPTLFHHPNVIDFLGMAWGSNPYSPRNKLPALVVEYAEHGSLAQLLKKKLDFDMKHLLCLDVARGLSALHKEGLVHGDVKADNILICNSPKRDYIAKISDFGFSIIEGYESGLIWMGGTDPWRAPETASGPVPLEATKHTDTYSFGLLVWSLCLDGQSPFDFVKETPMTSEEIAYLKEEDRLLTDCLTGAWLTRSVSIKFNSLIKGLDEQTADLAHIESPTNVQTQIRLLLPMLKDWIVKYLNAQTRSKVLVRSLSDIFKYSLQSRPECRDLGMVAAILESATGNRQSGKTDQDTSVVSSVMQQFIDLLKQVSVDVRQLTSSTTDGKQNQSTEDAADTIDNGASLRSSENNITKSKEAVRDRRSWGRRGYKQHRFSWQKTRDLEPSVQNFIAQLFAGREDYMTSPEKCPELFVLGAYYMNGYGCNSDVNVALQKLQQAAELGSHVSRAFLHRVWAACRPQGETENPGRRYLEEYAKLGSRIALEELRKIGPKDKYDDVYGWVTDASGGVGANWLYDSGMLNGYHQSQWIDDVWLMQKVRDASQPPSELVVNKRGDTVLHFVAMCGRWRPFKILVQDFKMDVNLRNPLGETPLLCACRSGQGRIVILCLQQFKADAAIAANNGETPLHWLVHFDDQYIEPMVKDLIANGAQINAETNTSVRHSIYPAGIDVDFHLAGTPLDWAVHDNRPHTVQTLLKHGADPNHTTQNISSALQMSAYYHHHQCLKIMIEHLESKVTQKTSTGEVEQRHATMYGPLVAMAEKAADKFSMILRGGEDFIKRLHSTFDFLRAKTELINFSSSFQGSLLYTAVSRAHDELVEYMFDRQWLVETINMPIGDAQRTPVLEAIRWNRESLVQTLINHGADIHALACNPFAPEERNWSALHIHAQEGHDRNLSMVTKLVRLGLAPDGPSPRATPNTINLSPMTDVSFRETNASDVTTAPDLTLLSMTDCSITSRDIESPFAIAVRHNAFNLANKLLSLGADPNSLAMKSGLFAADYPLTVLGHLIVSNARHSLARLAYLLQLESTPIEFIVGPTQKLTALHQCAMAHQGIKKRDGGAVLRAEFDMDNNSDIMYQLLLKWRKPEELDAVCSIDRSTALHLAVSAQNPAGVRSLLEAGASTRVRNDKEETALQLARSFKGQPDGESIEALLMKFEQRD
ncbi:MAG: hypothetical protein Q9200_006753 [Gallowayella weberi]